MKKKKKNKKINSKHISFNNNTTIDQRLCDWVEKNGKSIDSIIEFITIENAGLISLSRFYNDHLPEAIKEECLVTMILIYSMINKKDRKKIWSSFPPLGPALFRVGEGEDIETEQIDLRNPDDHLKFINYIESLCVNK